MRVAHDGVLFGDLACDVASIDRMKYAAKAIAGLVKKPTAQKIVPDMFDKRVVAAVAKAIR